MLEIRLRTFASCALVLGLGCASPAPPPTPAARFDARYRHSTLWQAIEAHEAAASPGQPAVVARDVPIRVRVDYLGAPRPVREAQRRLIAAWARARGHATAPTDFEHEIEVREREERYWLPIQRTLVGDFVRAHAPGARVELYVMYLGTVLPDGAVGPSSVFIVNGYRALP